MRNQVIQIPLPLNGLNTVDPYVPLESRYARELTNYSLYNGKLLVRPAARNTVSRTSLDASAPVVWFDPSSTDYPCILDSGGAIRNLSDGSGATSIGGTPSFNATRVKHSTLDLVIGLREPRLAASPFTAWTFTTNVVTATAIRAACSHRGRLYVANNNTLEYSDIAQITGAIPTGNSFTLTHFLDGQSIFRIFSATISPTDTTQNVLVIFGSGGKVLVYQGDYPGSATWDLLGKFDMPKPSSNITFVEVDGDIFVGAAAYAYWFRDLFTGGSQAAYINSPSRPIENLWQGCYALGDTNGGDSSYYEPKLDAIVTSRTNPDVATALGDGIIDLVYFRKYKAWAVWHFNSGLTWPIIQGGTASVPVIYGTEGGVAAVKQLTHDNMADQFLSAGGDDIEATWKTPYIQPVAGMSTKLNAVRPFYQNSVTGYFEKIRAIVDFSDYNSPFGWYTPSTVTAINPGFYADQGLDLPAATWSQFSPHVGLGIAGTVFSLQFTQKRKAASSATQTQAMHAAFCYMEQGGGI